MNQNIFEKVYKIWKTAQPNERIWTNALADECGFPSSESLRSAFKRARRKQGLDTRPEAPEELPLPETTEIHKDGSISSERIIAIQQAELKDPQALLRLHGFDPALWEIAFCKNSIYQRQSRDEMDGKTCLFSSKITCRPKVQAEINKDALRKIFDSLVGEYTFPCTHSHPDRAPGEEILVVGLADFHYALRAEKTDSNGEYNPQVAERVFDYIIEDVIAKTASRQFEKVVFWNGGDFFNCDTLKGSTTNGTPQDNAINYYDMVKRGAQILIRGLDRLSQVAPVEYIYSISNHDRQTIFMLSLILEAWYRDNPRVTVQTNNLERYYLRYYNSLLGFCHDLDPRKAHKLMSEEARSMWDTPYKYYFLAHLHHENVVMDGSVEIHRLSTPATGSAWSYDEGYVGAIRKCQSFIIHRRYGLTDILNTTIEE